MPASTLTPQLPLGLKLKEKLDFASFYSAGEGLALAAVKQAIAGSEPLIYLHGPAQSGKSHLLQAATRAALADGRSAFYLSLAATARAAMEASELEQLADCEVVCLDDVAAIADDIEWQTALFMLFNQLREARGSLIVAANCGPADAAFTLADLSSRLSWGLTVTTEPLDDAGKQKLLQSRARQRGFELSDEVAEYLFKHLPRDMNAQLRWLDELDSATLASRRKLTIPLVRSVIKA